MFKTKKQEIENKIRCVKNQIEYTKITQEEEQEYLKRLYKYELELKEIEREEFERE